MKKLLLAAPMLMLMSAPATAAGFDETINNATAPIARFVSST